MSEPFAEKLHLVMDLLSIGRTAIVERVGIDKSVVSRWLQGAVTPSAHNLMRLTELVAESAPGFTALDWQRDAAGLTRLLGAGRETAPATEGASGLAHGLTLNIIEQALGATGLRGRAYEGFWRTLRPADDPEVGFAYDYVYVRLAPNGLLAASMASLGSVAEGWLLPLHNQLFMLVADTTSGSITYSCMNGMASTKVDVLDGVGVGASHDPGRTPTALPVYTDRIADLSGDDEADEAFFAELARNAPLPTKADITDQVLAHILPDFGPAAAGRGGDWLLQVTRSRSLARSATPQAQIAAGPSRLVPPRRGPDWQGGDPVAVAFSEKLTLVLKLLNLSSAQVAHALEVHKSVVSRWLNGGSAPAAHNLAALTALIAQRSPGFSRLDWDRTPGALMLRFGVDPHQIEGGRTAEAPVLTLPTWDQILATAALRGGAYEGFFRLTRPCALQPGKLLEEYALVQPNPGGLPRFRLAAEGAMLEGWLLTVHDQIHIVAADKVGGALMFGIFNGMGAARIGAVDGIVIGPSLDVGRSPTAMPVYGEHIEELSGDPAADERRLIELAAGIRRLDAAGVNGPVGARVLRDCGPTAFGQGGALVLQMPLEGCLTRAR
jgi:transcriptional regulator with XRE-family HTH domain